VPTASAGVAPLPNTTPLRHSPNLEGAVTQDDPVYLEEHLANIFQRCALSIGLFILRLFNIVYERLVVLVALTGVPAVMSNAISFCCGG